MLGAATVAAVTLSGMLAAAPASAATGTLRFDFGGPTSPVGEGYTAGTPATAYTAERGFGFTSTTGLTFRDRGGSDPVARDFVNQTTPYEFKVDVQNGKYDITTFTGDPIASSRTGFTLEGAAQPQISAASGVVAENRYPGIVVNDGQLNILISGSSWRVNGIVISPALGTPAGLTGSADVDADPLSVSLTWSDVTDAAGYRVYRAAGDGKPEQLGETDAAAFRDETVVLGRTYTYTVRALGADGAESDAHAFLTDASAALDHRSNPRATTSP